jgi:hypothetical protein
VLYYCAGVVLNITKNVILPEVVHADLTSIKEELTSLTGKPFSDGMTVSLLIAIYRAHLSEPCARDAFRQRMANADFLTPEDFEKAWDKPPSSSKKRKRTRSR